MAYKDSLKTLFLLSGFYIMDKELNKKNKPVSLKERWESDIESRYYMLKNNPLEVPPITQEERERCKREFNITFPDDI